MMNNMVKVLRKLFHTEHKTELKPDTCDGCIHLYYNSDGSVSCDHPFEKTCLTGYSRFYKEFKKGAQII